MVARGVDALVIFGATGDLAKLETFPALVGLVDRGVLDVPVVGVAKSGWGLEQFRDYAVALFIHIGFLTGYRNRIGAIFSWWFAFTRNLRRERTYTTREVGQVRDVYAAQMPPPTTTNGGG
jgi:Glucose-6-phosphate dehydrogenase, NAD binding domain